MVSAKILETKLVILYCPYGNKLLVVIQYKVL